MTDIKKLTESLHKKYRLYEQAFESGPYLYFTKHGLGPGTIPRDVELIEWKDMPNYMTAIWLDRPLTSEELEDYDIYPEWGERHKELKKQLDSMDEDWSGSSKTAGDLLKDWALSESMKRSSHKKINEARWNYTLRSSKGLRHAIHEEDATKAAKMLCVAYRELLDAGLIDEDDYEDYVERPMDLAFSDPEDWDDFEDEVDFELSEFYDLCDNIGVWVSLEESKRSSKGSRRLTEEVAGWIAFYSPTGSSDSIQKLEIVKGKDANSMLEAKEFAIKYFKVPKSKLGMLSVHPAYNESYKKGIKESKGSSISISNMKKDIEKAKNALKKKAKQKGVWENFGQDEVRKIDDKYSSLRTENYAEYSRTLNAFSNWCANYTPMSESYKKGIKESLSSDAYRDYFCKMFSDAYKSELKGFGGTLSSKYSLENIEAYEKFARDYPKVLEDLANYGVEIPSDDREQALFASVLKDYGFIK